MIHDADIKRLFTAGKSYLQIAAELHLTKGKVAGRCRKMGLVREGSTRVGKWKGVPVPSVVSLVPRDPIGFMDLRASSCRYPIGDMTRDGFKFCGADKIGNSSYCRQHTILCHQVKQGRAA